MGKTPSNTHCVKTNKAVLTNSIQLNLECFNLRDLALDMFNLILPVPSIMFIFHKKSSKNPCLSRLPNKKVISTFENLDKQKPCPPRISRPRIYAKFRGKNKCRTSIDKPHSANGCNNQVDNCLHSSTQKG